MKNKLISLITLATHGLIGLGQTNVVQDFRFGLSPFYREADCQKVRQKLMRFILEAPLGSRIAVDDAYNLQSIAIFDVPSSTKLRFDSPANRSRLLAQPLASLTRWFTQSVRSSDTNRDLKETAALKVPEWLGLMSSQPAKEACAVVIIGSPLYRSSTEPAILSLPAALILRFDFCKPSGASPFAARNLAHLALAASAILALHSALIPRFPESLLAAASSEAPKMWSNSFCNDSIFSFNAAPFRNCDADKFSNEFIGV